MGTEGIWIAQEVGEGYGGKWVVVRVGMRVEFDHCCGVGVIEWKRSISGGYMLWIYESASDDDLTRSMQDQHAE